MSYMDTLTIRIPDELRADLQAISSRRSVPVSDLVPGIDPPLRGHRAIPTPSPTDAPLRRGARAADRRRRFSGHLMRIVLDANVVVAAFAVRGLCESVFEFCLESHEILLSEGLLDEILRNLAKKVKLDPATTAEIGRLLRDSGPICGTRRGRVNRVPGCRRFAGAGAGESRRAEYLVSGDRDLLAVKRFGNCRIVTPREFWSLMRQAK